MAIDMRPNWIAAVAVHAGVLFGQTAPPAFEVTSVKLNTSMGNGSGNKFSPGSARWTNVPLKALIGEIYRLKSYQILGGPSWIDSDRWDIEGQAAGPATIRK